MAELEEAVFGAGCFWGVEERFRTTEGVEETEAGYAGGDVDDPSYRDVCAGKTGHAEVVRVEYDPEVINYEGLLDVFFDLHDPTQRNRQGPDVGSQYRSVIFAGDKERQEFAEQYIEVLEASGKYDDPVATSVEGAVKFWPAEDYHQKYALKNGGGGCSV